ncbi:MAG: hypothetical protein MUE34_01050 [Acidimicrobiales bacterium]|nr:hypothetical protein [Acidimicrobiales bacterium]
MLGTVLLLMGVSAIAASALGPDDAERVPVEVLGAVETAEPVPAEVPAPPEEAVGAEAPPPVAVAVPPTVVPLAPLPDLPPAEELVGAAAFALLPIDPAVRLPDWELVFLPGRDGVRALTFPRDRRIEVYVRETDTPEALVRVLAHELGHAVDVADNDAADRARWRAARGAGPEVAWWPDGTTYDFDTLAGDFAEAYATWLVGSESVSRVGGPFTPEQLALVAELVG